MNRERKLIVVAALLVVIAMVIVQPAHAQTITYRYDQASYTPGSSGTIYFTIINTSAGNTLEIRNITLYFPWAGFYNGNWQGGNISVNLSPFKVLTTSGSPGGGNIYAWSTGFTVPGWYPGGTGGTSCPGGTNTRYGLYGSCFLLGTNLGGYETQFVSIVMAGPTYQSASFSLATILPIASFVVLIAAVVLLFFAWTSLRRIEHRKTA